MNNHNSKDNITVLGIDLAKSSFQLHGVDEKGNTVLKKKLNRTHLTSFIAKLSLALEACGGAHHWVRVFKAIRCAL